MSAAGSMTNVEPATASSAQGSLESANPIILIDHTQTQDLPSVNQAQTQSTDTATEPSAGNLPVERQLSRRWTRSSLQKSRTERKYARYQEDRFVEQAGPEGSEDNPIKSRAQRGKTLVKEAWHGKKVKQRQEEDTVTEILYENQRGIFTFGFPHFSSKSLLNFDPKPWTNAHKRSSPVNITNAQVPDPNWEWAWKSWYVDMSHDVDEDGWEYSLAFYGCAWHGTHPWFHSFVRRRRWLRMRVRKQPQYTSPRKPGQKHFSESHMLTPDYFTIHPTRSRSVVDRPASIATSGSLARAASPDSSEDTTAREVSDIATLLLLLRHATIDREKIVLIRSFLQNATDELYYLSQEMPHIMSLLMFQNSRRDLLRLLMDELAAASEHRGQHREENKEEGEKEGKRMDYLLSATDAAEKEVKKLQYWSDIRVMVREGKAIASVDGAGWEGLDADGPGLGGDGAKEEGRRREEVEAEAKMLETRASKDSVGSDGREGRSKSRVGYEQYETSDEEELPRIGPGNDNIRSAVQEPVDLEVYDKAKEA